MSINIRIVAALEIVAVFGLALFLMWVIPMVLTLNPVTTQVAIWCIYLVSLVLIWRLQQRPGAWRELGLKPIDRWLPFIGKSLLVAVLAFLAFVLIGAVAFKMGWIKESLNLSGYEFLKARWWYPIVSLLAVYISSSFGEEVVFRGFLISRFDQVLSGKHPQFWSVALSGLIFGLAHFAWGPLGILQTAAMGWTLGYFYIRYGRQLWINVVAHAILDSLLFLQMI